jgi:hypothetical protein
MLSLEDSRETRAGEDGFSVLCWSSHDLMPGLMVEEESDMRRYAASHNTAPEPSVRPNIYCGLHSTPHVKTRLPVIPNLSKRSAAPSKPRMIATGYIQPARSSQAPPLHPLTATSTPHARSSFSLHSTMSSFSATGRWTMDTSDAMPSSAAWARSPPPLRCLSFERV